MRRALTKTQVKSLQDAMKYVKDNRDLVTAYAMVVVTADEHLTTMVSYDRCVDALGAIQLLDAKAKMEIIDTGSEDLE